VQSNIGTSRALFPLPTILIVAGLLSRSIEGVKSIVSCTLAPVSYIKEKECLSRSSFRGRCVGLLQLAILFPRLSDS